jgi:hypothetical protein
MNSSAQTIGRLPTAHYQSTVGASTYSKKFYIGLPLRCTICMDVAELLHLAFISVRVVYSEIRQ